MDSSYLSICKVISCLLLSDFSRRCAKNLDGCEVPQHCVWINQANRLQPSYCFSFHEGELLSAFSVAFLDDEECKKCQIDILLVDASRNGKLDLVQFSEHLRIFNCTGWYELLETLIAFLSPITISSLGVDQTFTVHSFVVPVLSGLEFVISPLQLPDMSSCFPFL